MTARPIRLLMLAPRVFEPPYIGGGERYVSQFARALARHSDLDLTLVTVTSPTNIELKCPAASRRRLSVRSLAAVCRSADIVHVHQVNSFAFDLAALLTIATRKPLVLTDLGGGWLTPGRVLGRSRNRLVAGLACLSSASAADLGWNSSRPTERLYGGGEHVLDTAEPTGLRPTDFLYVGRLLPHKGIELLIDALPSDSSLRIAGSARDPRFVSHLQSSSEGKDVEFIVDPPDEQLYSLYKASRFTVLPSHAVLDGKLLKRAELLGLVLLESLSCGTPCLGSDIPAIREVLEPIGMPTFRSSNSEMLRDTLRRLRHCDNTAYAHYRNLCASAADRYSWPATAKRAYNFYRYLLRCDT